jgi:hypothetical protein
MGFARWVTYIKNQSNEKSAINKTKKLIFCKILFNLGWLKK